MLKALCLEFIRGDRRAHKVRIRQTLFRYLTEGHYPLHASGLKLLIFKCSEKGHLFDCCLCQILPFVNISFSVCLINLFGWGGAEGEE